MLGVAKYSRTLCTSLTSLRSICDWKWEQPKGKPTGVKIYNSLTQNKDDLCYGENENFLTWYSCGPTVYDESHVGHGRCYVQQDIILRILEKFNVNVFYTIGITDIDDKIIKKSIDQNVTIKTVASEYEQKFWQDMDSLGIKKPTAITRVSEHLDEIQRLVKEMYEGGFAYIGKDESIYFDIEEYKKRVSFYPIPFKNLSNESKNENSNKKNDADFALWKSSASQSVEGISNDAAGASFSNIFERIKSEWIFQLSENTLIKGRPGWHIECSAMCHKLFADKLDIHSGGIDLLYPHHCNEVAQSQAFYFSLNNSSYRQWPNYFFHVGHLHIEGLKMSKSLKNFITIREFLKEHTANELRWYCFLTHYRNNADFTTSEIQRIRGLNAKLTNFLTEIHVLQQNHPDHQVWNSGDFKIFNSFIKLQQQVTEHLRNDFDTPKAMDDIFAFVDLLNVYMTQSSKLPANLISSIFEYFKSFFQSMGFNTSEILPKTLAAAANTAPNASSENSDREMQLIDQLVSYRSDIRNVLLNKSLLADGKLSEIFKLSDTYRTSLHTDFNVEIKDRPIPNPSTWRIIK